MSVVLAVAVAALLLLAGCSTASSTPDLNPSLGAYQDETECFPFKSYLYQIYRNFESDPYFGDKAKCVRTGPTGSLVNSSFQTTFEYGSDGAIDLEVTVMSSPGYTVGNVLHLQSLNGCPYFAMYSESSSARTNAVISITQVYSLDDVGKQADLCRDDCFREDLEPFNFTVAYRDCERCKVFRHSYVENGAGCSYWVTSDALGDDKTCCEFVYQLLCGTSAKYQIYDERCQ